jgi:ribosomal protein S18 acetylase RimI-like enzyme
MRLEPATPAHLPALHALVERAYRGDSARAGWSHEADLLEGQRTDFAALQDMLKDPTQHLLVSDDGVACVALTDKGKGIFYLGLLTVDPGRQASGLGKILMTEAERFAAHRLGANRIEMTVIVQRTELIAWYERRGYRQTGERRPFPYGDRRFGDPRRDDLEFVVLERCL